jgi:hypothetical protein
MKIEIEVYYKNTRTGKFRLLHEVITEDDIIELAKEKTRENGLYPEDEWKFESVTVERIETV